VSVVAKRSVRLKQTRPAEASEHIEDGRRNGSMLLPVWLLTA
jgi:hypothetical protein